MTRYAFIHEARCVLVAGAFRSPHDGQQYGSDWIEKSTPEDRAAILLLEVVDAAPVPAGRRIVSTEIRPINGVPTEVHTLEDIPLDDRKAAKLAALEVAYAAALAVGYPKTFDGTPETLQCRNEHDRTNWLGLIEKCRVAKDLGAGELPIDPPLRCTSNRKYAVTHNEASVIMLEILNWVGGVMGRYWDLKDAIEAANTSAELDAINVEIGW